MPVNNNLNQFIYINSCPAALPAKPTQNTAENSLSYIENSFPSLSIQDITEDQSSPAYTYSSPAIFPAPSIQNTAENSFQSLSIQDIAEVQLSEVYLDPTELSSGHSATEISERSYPLCLTERNSSELVPPLIGIPNELPKNTINPAINQINEINYKDWISSSSSAGKSEMSRHRRFSLFNSSISSINSDEARERIESCSSSYSETIQENDISLDTTLIKILNMLPQVPFSASSSNNALACSSSDAAAFVNFHRNLDPIRKLLGSFRNNVRNNRGYQDYINNLQIFRRRLNERKATLLNESRVYGQTTAHGLDLKIRRISKDLSEIRTTICKIDQLIHDLKGIIQSEIRLGQPLSTIAKNFIIRRCESPRSLPESYLRSGGQARVSRIISPENLVVRESPRMRNRDLEAIQIQARLANESDYIMKPVLSFNNQILFPFANEGDLSDHINDVNNAELRTEQKIEIYKRFFYQLAQAIQTCHMNNIIHCDIKPENILISGGEIKLSDFGLCLNVGNIDSIENHRIPGTYFYKAPELFDKERIITNFEPLDIYSFGATLYEALTGERLFSNSENSSSNSESSLSLGRKAFFYFRESIESYNNNLESLENEEARDLINQCLERNPENRPTIAQILQHPFFQDLL